MVDDVNFLQTTIFIKAFFKPRIATNWEKYQSANIQLFFPEAITFF
jgi:hypothetical protein